MNSRYDTLFNICNLRRSCRQFSDRAVSKQLTEQILAIAKLSPYAGGRKNWGVKVIEQRGTIYQIAVMVEEKLKESASLMDNDIAPSFLKYGESFLPFKDAPTLLVPFFRVSPTMKALLRDNITPELLQWERENCVKSISAVSTHILLAAESLGLGSCYMTGPLIAAAEISAILELPIQNEIGALIPIGYCK